MVEIFLAIHLRLKCEGKYIVNVNVFVVKIRSNSKCLAFVRILAIF